MKKMRLLVWAFVIMIIGGTWLVDCSCSKSSKTEDEIDSVVVNLDEMEDTDTVCDEFVAYRTESDSVHEELLSEERSEVIIKDSKGHPTGEFKLPQPGLLKEGVVFSFQPYSISCFAAGVFHFSIPYERLAPYLTERAKWCLGNYS